MPVPVEPSVPLFPDPDDEPSPVVPDVPPFEPVPLDESVPFWLEPLLELSDDDPLFPDVDPLVLLDVPLEVDESVDPLVVLSLPSVVVSSFESVESDLGFCTGSARRQSDSHRYFHAKAQPSHAPRHAPRCPSPDRR